MKNYRQLFLEDMQLKDFAPATIKGYFREVDRFFERGHLFMGGKKLPAKVTEADVKEYFKYLKNDRKYGVSALKIAVSGLQFFLGSH